MVDPVKVNVFANHYTQLAQKFAKVQQAGEELTIGVFDSMDIGEIKDFVQHVFRAYLTYLHSADAVHDPKYINILLNAYFSQKQLPLFELKKQIPTAINRLVQNYELQQTEVAAEIVGRLIAATMQFDELA